MSSGNIEVIFNIKLGDLMTMRAASISDVVDALDRHLEDYDIQRREMSDFAVLDMKKFDLKHKQLTCLKYMLQNHYATIQENQLNNQ
jgi:protein-arginine kinase